jgi:phosphate transport system permease protein
MTTDVTQMNAGPDQPNAGRANLEIIRAGLAVRKRRETRLRLIGLGAIALAFAALALIVGSIVVTGAPALRQTHVTLQVFVDPAEVDPARLERGGYDDMLEATMAGLFPEVTGREEMRALTGMLSNGAEFMLRDRIVADPGLIAQTISVTVPVSDPFDQLAKGLVDRATPEDQRRVTDAEIGWFDRMDSLGAVSKPLNTGLITNADSRFPELAGLRGALVGSFWLLVICFAIAFPLGIGAAIWLEEFAPRNKVSDIIEVNINNLAAVPSVVFGLLALAVFINWFGLPRSAPFVGGLTLALMTMPTIIIATRAALKAVPPSIREAALGVGASRQQVVMHHVLPLAMPGILTGAIIGMAQAIGETAPLLLIGMNAFITSAAGSPFDAATALPTQIFIWADSPERGFVSRTSAGILVLLVFLVLMNAVAIVLRNRFERKW